MLIWSSGPLPHARLLLVIGGIPNYPWARRRGDSAHASSLLNLVGFTQITAALFP